MLESLKKIEYVRSRPILFGVLSVCGTVAIGICIAYATGYTHPVTSFADDLSGIDSGIVDTTDDTVTADDVSDVTPTDSDSVIADDSSDVTPSDADQVIADDSSLVTPTDVDSTVSDDTSITTPTDADSVVADDSSDVTPTDADQVIADDSSDVTPTDSDSVITDDSSDVTPTDADQVIADDSSEVTPTDVDSSDSDDSAVTTPTDSDPTTVGGDDSTTVTPTDSDPETTVPDDSNIVTPPCCTVPVITTPPQTPPDDVNTVTPPCCTLPTPPETPPQTPPETPPTTPVIPAPLCTLTVTPSSGSPGASAKLSWTTNNATSVSINQHIGSVALNGSDNISVPTVTTTYTLTASGAGGVVNCAATININSPPPPAPTCTLVANPTAIQQGNAAALSWTTQNATSFAIDNHIGSVTPVAAGSTNVSPVVTTTYTGTATASNGKTVNCSATVTVTTTPPPPPPPAPTCTLSASPNTIQVLGSSNLNWTTTNATSFVIDNHIGSVTPVAAGSTSVSPLVTTTYTGTATNSSGQTVNCTTTVTVTVLPPPPQPECTLVANPTAIQQGSASSLSWTTSNATSFVINNHIGSVTPVAAGSTSVSPVVTTTYTGTATGSGGTVNCSATVTVTTTPPPPPPPAPTCTLAASPNTIQVLGSSVLSWTTTNATSFIINQHIGSVTPVAAGSTSVSPLLTTTYTGTATNASGQQVNCSTTVTVTVLPPPPQPECALVANPTAIQQGSSAALSWTTQNATSFAIDNHIGSVSPVAAGSTNVSPLVTTTYTGIATNASGQTVNCSATVTVTTAPPPPPPPAPTCTLTANPTSIQIGSASALSWTTTNATSFVIDNHIGSVTSVAAGSTSVSPLLTTTYTGTATNTSGQQVNCSATVTVTLLPPPPAPTCTLVVNPSSITQGQSSTLSWTTANANSFSIDQNIGSESSVASGSTNVSPANTTTYTGTATGANGQTVNCQTTVTVTTPGGGITPSCTLTASPSYINQGGSATLSWGGNYIQSVSISDIGTEGPSGSVNVSPPNSTNYVGTFTATDGETLTCEASVQVNIPPPPPPPPLCNGNCGGGSQYVYYQYQGSYTPPPVVPAAYVALSQIPYTGLDLGPIGTVVYWVALILICLSAAYLIVFNLLPFIYLKLKGIGLGVSAMVNAPAGLALAHGAISSAGAYVPPASPTYAPLMSASQPQKSAYSLDEGFRSFAEGKALTIDDIVNGLAREAAVAAPAAAAVAPITAQHGPVATEHTFAPVTHSASPVAYATPMSNNTSTMPVTPDVRDFIAALLNGDRTTVFTTLRQVVREGGDAEAFLTQVVCALDDAYRARLDGTPVHPEIAALTERCATPFLEHLTAALTNAVDSSYSPGISGSKLALTRALAVVEG